MMGIASPVPSMLMVLGLGWPAYCRFTAGKIAHIVFSMTNVATVVQSPLSQADQAIKAAAMALDARPCQVLHDIMLPLPSRSRDKPGVVSDIDERATATAVVVGIGAGVAGVLVGRPDWQRLGEQQRAFRCDD